MIFGLKKENKIKYFLYLKKIKLLYYVMKIIL